MKKILLMLNIASSLAVSSGISSQVTPTLNKSVISNKNDIVKTINYKFTDKYYVALADHSREHKIINLGNYVRNSNELLAKYPTFNFINSKIKLTNLSTDRVWTYSFNSSMNTDLILNKSSCVKLDSSNAQFRLNVHPYSREGWISFSWDFYRDIFTAGVKLEINLNQIVFYQK